MAPLILIPYVELAADLERLEARLSDSKTIVTSLLVLKEYALMQSALSGLADVMRAIHDDSLRAIVRVNLAIVQLQGGRR